MNNSHIFVFVLLAIFILTIASDIFVNNTGTSLYASSARSGTSAEKEQVAASSPAYVGANSCAACHQEQFDAWKGSHHDLAMQHANAKSVLGQFNNVRYEYNRVTTTLFKRDARYYVNTDGPDGQMHDYEIKYTFGVEPLQQYLVELPGGRLQALRIAWDSRPREEGGQHWFQLYPNQKIDHKDELHWTKLSQNWNHMCAECERPIKPPYH